MIDALEWLWPLADAARPTVAVHHTESWPVGVRNRLLTEGFLFEDALADRVLCPECLDHYEEVLPGEGPAGSVEFRIACPVLRRVRVSRDARRQWSVEFAALARSLAVALSLTGRVAELAPCRVWRLGRIQWQGVSRDVLLARGLHWSDGTILRGTISRAKQPIVIIPRAKPSGKFWSGRVPPVIALSEVATLAAGGIDIDPLEVAAAIQGANARGTKDAVEECTIEQLALKVRRLMKTELTDDIFVAAYRQHGSLRKAAEFLTQESGRPITKDQVQRAVARAGGIDEVLNSESSDSVIRPSESRKRDRKGKVVVQSKANQGC